jgi:DNA-binding transcriptional regulator YbjK
VTGLSESMAEYLASSSGQRWADLDDAQREAFRVVARRKIDGKAALAEVENTRNTLYELAAADPQSECLHEAWANLDAAHTLMQRYLRLL